MSEKPMLTVLSGPSCGRTVEVDGEISIGRSPDNLLQLDDLQVSRKHAVVKHTPAGTIIRDLGSGNGTFIGDHRILEYRLSHGDVIRIGPATLQYKGTGVSSVRPVVSAALEGSDVMTAGVRFDTNGGDNPLQATAADSVFQTLFGAPDEATSVEQLRTLQTRLAAVYEANQIIASERDLTKLFERVMEQLFQLIPAHNGVILLRSEDTGELQTEFVKSGAVDQDVVISSSIVRRAYKQGEAVITYDASGDARFETGASIIAQNISSAMCAPLSCQGECLGVLYVDTRGTTSAFAESDLELLVALSGPAGIAIKNAQYVARLRRAYHDTLVVLANAIEMRDHYTVGHTWRVTNFGLATARKLGWSPEKMAEAEMGGVLHDVGKISIEDAILCKPDKLTAEEFEKMKVHPERGARLMQDVDFLQPLIPYTLYHHERYDGRGYPYGLAGTDIPLEGRLLAVADTFDAMTSNRPYRKGLDPEIAIAELKKNKGTQFDPEIVDAFVQAYEEGAILPILQNTATGERTVACPFCSTNIDAPASMALGEEFNCNVCHRKLRLRHQNNMFYAELLSGTQYRPRHEGTEATPEGT